MYERSLASTNLLNVLVGPNSPPNSTSTPNSRDAAFAAELSRVTALWNLYGVGAGLPDPKLPPQQEALNLEVPTRNSEGAHTPKVSLLSPLISTNLSAVRWSNMFFF